MDGKTAPSLIQAEIGGDPSGPLRGRDAPLVVDIDGTLLRTDLLYECLVLLAFGRPWLLFLLPVWLLRGKAHLKRELARRVTLDVDSLPANEEILAWLAEEKARGRTLALFSASDDTLARRVAARFGDLFDVVQGSDGATNLSGERKLAAIRARFGPIFTYVGDSGCDLVIWESCRSAVLAGPADRLRRRLAAGVEIDREFGAPAAGARIWARTLRLHQWVKNTLLFVPLLLAGHIGEPDSLVLAALGFLAFGLMASASYLLNDLSDLHADRMHRSKRLRPLARGELPLRSALMAVPALAAAVVGLLAFLPAPFAAVTALYLAVTLAYSFHLKRQPVLDLVVLAFLFTVRILAGTVVLDLPASPWLLTFSMFFFFSLAAIKRYSECLLMAAEGRDAVLGRGYRAADAPLLMALGVASGFCSTLVFFIYLVDGQSPLRNYPHPEWMWLICVIFGYWLARAWLLASRGEMHDDPVLFALRDRLSLFLGGLTVLLVYLAHS